MLRYPLGSPITRSPMMLCWISLVPPAMVSARDASIRYDHLPLSSANGDLNSIWLYGPSNSIANLFIRKLSSLTASFSTEPSGPGGKPLSRRVI